jgi:regulator of sirC expression with transglutaminase-like and TPR domain
VELTERFADLVTRPSFPLDEAALLVAAHADPTCDIAANLARLDDLASSVPEPTIEALTTTLFGSWGFVGDQVDYYDPRNSYLHEVLERRRGIPITLSVVLIEVGRRAGVTLAGVGTPAHFLTCTTSAEPRRWIDAFAGGRVLDRAELDDQFSRLAPGIDLDPYLDPVTPAQVVGRILANLVTIHRHRNDRTALLWATRLRTLVPGTTPDDRRAYGGALAACGDFVRAAKVLESLVADGHAGDPDDTLAQARRLRARLN